VTRYTQDVLPGNALIVKLTATIKLVARLLPFTSCISNPAVLAIVNIKTFAVLHVAHFRTTMRVCLFLVLVRSTAERKAFLTETCTNPNTIIEKKTKIKLRVRRGR